MTALLTDLYQLTMLQAYLDEGMQQEATFELVVRKLPRDRNFLVAAGLEQALQFLETLVFTEDEIAWRDRQGGFTPRLLDHLRALRFTDDVHAMPEGTVFFASEPILRVTAPLPVAQLIESRPLNLVDFQTLIASKAARVVLAAPGKLLIDFGTSPASTAPRPPRRRACLACLRTGRWRTHSCRHTRARPTRTRSRSRPRCRRSRRRSMKRRAERWPMRSTAGATPANV